MLTTILNQKTTISSVSNWGFPIRISKAVFPGEFAMPCKRSK